MAYFGFFTPNIVELVEKRGEVTPSEVAQKFAISRERAQSLLSHMTKPTRDYINPSVVGSYLVKTGYRSEHALWKKRVAREPVYKRGTRRCRLLEKERAD